MRALARAAETDSAPVAAAIASWLAERPGLRTVATYSGLPGEVDLARLPALQPSRRWLYPKVRGEHLAFHEIRNPERDLAPGAFGILEPADHTPVIAPAEIDAFLCPGLAFDPRGGRLGRGRGFYDRALALASPQALRIGVCFPWQLVADTFAEPHDIAMHHVIRG